MASFVEILNRAVLLFFFASELIERKLKSLVLVQKAIELLEFLFIMFMLLRRMLAVCSNLQPGFTVAEKMFDQALQFAAPSEYFCLALTILSCLLLLIVVLVRTKVIDVNHRDAACWACSVLFLMLRLCLQPIAMQTFFAFTEDDSGYPLLGVGRFLVVAVLLIAGFYCLILNLNKLTLSVLHVLLPVVWMLLPSDLLLIVTSIVYNLYCYFDKIKQREQGNIYQLMLLISSVWYLIDMLTPVVQFTEFLLLITYLLATVSLLFTKEMLLPVNKRIQIEGYWRLTERKKESKLSMEEEFEIEQIVIEQYINGDEKELEKLRAVDKQVPQWERSEHLQLLKCQIQSYTQGKNDQAAEIFEYRLKLEDEKRNLRTLLDLSKRFEELGNSMPLFRYRLYELIARLQNWFERCKTETAYLKSVAQIDRKVSRFYVKLHAAAVKLKKVWLRLQDPVMEFDEIEDKYTEVLQLKTEVEQLYRQISMHSEATAELANLKTLLGFLSASYNDTTASVPAEGERLHPQLPYLIVKDGKIVEVPFRFISEFGYSTQELLLSPIEMIVPTVFQKDFLKLDGEATGVKFQEQHQLIIDGEGNIRLANMECYVIPDFTDGIRYLLLLDERINQTNKPFLLYNTKNDSVEEASREFLQEFGVDPTIFQGQPIHGKDVFEAFDWNSEQNRRALETAEGAPATINLKKLTGTATRHKVFVRVLTRFEGQEKPRILVSVSRNRPSAKEAMMTSDRQLCRQFDGNVSNPLLPKSEKGYEMSDSPKIADPLASKYQADLVEKKDNLKRNEFRRSLVPLTITMYVFCGVLFAGFVGLYVAGYLRLQWYDFMVKEVKDINTRNLYLSEMMMQCLTLYHLQQYPPTQLTTDQNLAYRQQAQARLQQATLSFQELYVSNLQKERFQELSLNLQFKNYNLSVSTEQIFLIDFVWESALLATNNVLTFMLDNFGVIALLRQQIAGLDLYKSSYMPYVTMSEVIGYVLGVLGLALYSTFIGFTYPIERTLGEVEKLYKFLPRAAAQRQVSSISQFIQSFSAIEHTNQTGALGHTSREPNSSYTSLLDNDRPKDEQPQNRQTCGFALRSVLQLAVLAIFIGLYVANMTTFLNQETSVSSMTVNGGHRMRLEELDMKNSALNSYYKLLLMKYKGQNFTASYNSTLANTLSNINQEISGVAEMSPFANNWWRTLNQDLCEGATDMDQDQCRQVYLGILQQGYSKSIDEYQNGLKRLEATTLDNLYDTSFLSDSLIAQKYLLSKSHDISQQFMRGQEAYRSGLAAMHVLYLACGLLVAGFLTLLLYWNWRREALRIDLCRLLFVNAPDEMLNSEECLSSLEKSGLPDRLLKL